MRPPLRRGDVRTPVFRGPEDRTLGVSASARHTEGVPEPVSASDVLAMPFFVDLDENAATEFARHLAVRLYQPRELILTAGGRVPGFFYVRRGRVRVYRAGRDGREQALRVAGPGDTFAEVPVFDGGPAPSNVEAVDEAEIVVVPAEVFRRIVARSPAVASRLLAHFARLIRAFTELIEQISLQTVQARVARYLYQLAREEGAETAAGIEVPRELTVHDLATLVGSVREVVARVLKSLEEDGLITIERKRYIVHDLQGLRETS